jgi:hypothetical protein
VTPDQLKASLFIEEAVNEGNLDVIEDVYAEVWVDHDLGHPLRPALVHAAARREGPLLGRRQTSVALTEETSSLFRLREIESTDGQARLEER